MSKKYINLTIFNIIHWVAGTIVSLTKRLMYYSFHNFLQNSLQKLFNFFYFLFFNIKKSFECPKSIRNYEKKNTWNIRRLVNESFVPLAQPTSVLYCRLSDFKVRASWGDHLISVEIASTNAIKLANSEPFFSSL